MDRTNLQKSLGRFMSNYGMVFVLLLLCAYYSVATLSLQYPAGESGGRQLAGRILKESSPGARILIVVRENQEDRDFASAMAAVVSGAGLTVLETVTGTPAEARAAMERIVTGGGRIDLIACSAVARGWGVFDNLPARFPALAETRLVTAASYRWPNFLKADNLLNVANQIVVMAIIAIGMTMVIITAGIDLSVGSLIAFSAVVTTWSIRGMAGAEEAAVLGMVGCCLLALLSCAAIGLFSGSMVTVFNIPPFIVTLAMMLVASGLAYLLAQGQSIYQVPTSFIWLGRGTSLGGLPNAVLLMIFLYGVAHLVMSRMTLGRYIYAVGGNREAARLSGVPVKRVVLLVYTLSGALAGLGGIVLASQLKSGAPTYGQMEELYVIAAVVVGGTSLAGGEGRVLGTLIGAFIIGVIRNGMNLTGVEPYTQKVVLGLVILGAVLLDMLKKRRWIAPRWLKSGG